MRFPRTGNNPEVCGAPLNQDERFMWQQSGWLVSGSTQGLSGMQAAFWGGSASCGMPKGHDGSHGSYVTPPQVWINWG